MARTADAGATEPRPALVVNGGGLVGCLAAVYMARLGFDVRVYEKRVDIRSLTAESGRSINLILTSRGLHALREVGLEDAAKALCVPVQGRMMHGADGTAAFQPYGISRFEVNYSVSRTQLNGLLISAAEKEGARFFFEHDLSDMAITPSGKVSLSYRRVSWTATSLAVVGSASTEVDVVLGTDGVGSATRRLMLGIYRNLGIPAYDCIDRLGISYREVTFPADALLGQYSMRPDALHIWPRGAHFLMALADKTPTFTGTLYLPDYTAEIRGLLPVTGAGAVPSFDSLGKSREKIEAYVSQTFPDVPSIVPNVVDQLLDEQRPHSFLATLRTTHWVLDGKIALLGDAAHGVVPFFGQGMNLGFESVVVLVERIRRARTLQPSVRLLEALKPAFAAYQADHHPGATAIANMAIENFSEMSFKVGQPAWLARKKVENELESALPSLIRSRYYMVTKTLIPYDVVYRIGVFVDACVDDVVALLASGGSNPPLSVATVLEDRVHSALKRKMLAIVEERVTSYLRRLDVELDRPLKPYYGRPRDSWHMSAGKL